MTKQKYKLMNIGGTVLEHLSHHPKLEGLNPTPATGTGR
jgi:hypothetical protein